MIAPKVSEKAYRKMPMQDVTRIFKVQCAAPSLS